MTIEELLDYLDEQGLVITDYDTIAEALAQIGYALFDELETR